MIQERTGKRNKALKRVEAKNRKEEMKTKEVTRAKQLEASMRKQIPGYTDADSKISAVDKTKAKAKAFFQKKRI